eukprot:Skav208175  [mRNA]  locus=scaffold2530:32669:33145:+ [translate_table: standard]
MDARSSRTASCHHVSKVESVLPGNHGANAGGDVANLKCSAKLEGHYYILNGEKKWNGILAHYFIVACRAGKPGVGGVSLLLVDKGMEGLETGKMKCSGAWSSGATYITFDDVKVPRGNLLGKEGQRFQYIMQNFSHERLAPAEDHAQDGGYSEAGWLG